MPIYNQGSPGLGNVASYQVSGKPFATGSIRAPAFSGSTAHGAAINGFGTPVKVEFPSVTRWVKIMPVSGSSSTSVTHLRVGFSEEGVKNDNYFRLFVGGDDTGMAGTFGGLIVQTLDPDPLELKVTELYFLGDSTQDVLFDVVAGLTGIDKRNITNNWSGSSGVG